MIEPPDPHIPGILLAVAAKLGFVFKVRDAVFGELGAIGDANTEHKLFVTSGGGARVTWSLEGSARLDPHLMTRATFDVLARGELQEDNTIAYQKTTFRLRWRWSASGMLAEAVALETSN